MKFNLLILLLTFIISIIIIEPVGKINNKYIYIDPGHGGFDGGTSSSCNLLEKDLVLDIAYLIKDYLEKYGYNVVLTRYKDISLGKTKKEDIYKRVDLINKENVMLYLSIHANYYTSSNVKGAQVFYSKESNKLLADTIKSYIDLVDNTKRIVKSIKGKYLLDNTNTTGCLIEVGFLSNIDDVTNLKNPFYLSNLSKYISLGVIDYLSKEGE